LGYFLRNINYLLKMLCRAENWHGSCSLFGAMKKIAVNFWEEFYA